MPVDIIVGTQWGDEGKGHITDLLSSKANLVARFSGGDNAGHTVTIGQEIFKLHLIPSGIIHHRSICLIGNGVVINPQVFIEEVEGLIQRGINVHPGRLKVSDRAHIITPGHLALDEAIENAKGRSAIGTTKRGIGPAYTDKSARIGIRAGLMRSPSEFDEAVVFHIKGKNALLAHVYGEDELDVDSIRDNYREFARYMHPYLADTSAIIHEALASDSTIIAEGAQGTLLDLDHGTYPYVTSSWPTAAGALGGLGIGPKHIGRVIGVTKAFTSRVGEGPFPTEITGDEAVRLRGTGTNPWDEFGTTTGRPRRVGWLDLAILRYSTRINGLSELALTKLDILSSLPEIPVCVSYRLKGEMIDHFPSDLHSLSDCEPEYVSLPGWKRDITGARSWADLPPNAQQYIEFISDSIGIPIKLLSVGPGRQQIVSL